MTLPPGARAFALAPGLCLAAALLAGAGAGAQEATPDPAPQETPSDSPLPRPAGTPAPGAPPSPSPTVPPSPSPTPTPSTAPTPKATPPLVETPLARQLWDTADARWTQKPPEGVGRVRVLLRAGGQPLAGRATMRARFSFKAVPMRKRGEGAKMVWEPSEDVTHVPFNPSSTGRFVSPDLVARTYEVSVEDSEKTYVTWRVSPVTLKAGKLATYEVDLAKREEAPPPGAP